MITGYVIDANTGQGLYMANVYASDAEGNLLDGGLGTTTDFEGNYSLSQPAQYITASYVGYNKQTRGGAGGRVNFELKPGIGLKPVEIRAKRPVKDIYIVTGALAVVIAIALIVKYS